jgi:AcrR family transcriptional regulator
VSQEPKPRLDRDARREAILDVAREVFMDEGYAAASMSTIAARLGGSKGTLYNYFKSKDELFTAYVRRHCAWQEDAMFSLLDDGEDHRGALMRLARKYLSTVMSDYNLKNFRLITAEAERSPAIGVAFYESGPLRGAQLLGDFLKRMADEGRLRLDDPLLAAHQFMALCQNRLMKARLCNYIPEPTAEQIEAEAESAVAMFLAAYGA